MIFQCLPAAFRVQLLEAVHDFRLVGGDTFKMALYLETASLDPLTASYTTTGEASGTNYVAGGVVLTVVSPSASGGNAIVTFADVTFTNVTLSARGAMIYNTTPTHTYTNPTVAIIDFGMTKTWTAQNAVIKMPTNLITI